MPCGNFTCVNGSCLVSGGKAGCVCSMGYAGEHCDVPTICLNSSCLNGGTCKEKMGVIECSCPKGFMGSTCQEISSNQLSREADERTDNTLGIALSVCLVVFFCALAMLTFMRYLKHKRETKPKPSPEEAIPKCKTPPLQMEMEEYDLRPMKRSSLAGVQDFFLNMNIDAPENVPAEAQIPDVKIDQYGLAKSDTRANQDDDQESHSLADSEYLMGNTEPEKAGDASSPAQQGSPRTSVTIRQDNESDTASVH
ncbi:hypothetical protein M514_25093, partial [Trichuris suis]